LLLLPLTSPESRKGEGNLAWSERHKSTELPRLRLRVEVRKSRYGEGCHCLNPSTGGLNRTLPHTAVEMWDLLISMN
jgi:hypothetical protein